MAISALLDQPELAPFFQSRLINDGVGIFCATEEALPPDLPRRWGRSYATFVKGKVEKAADSTSIKVNRATEATGLYKRERAGKLILDFTWQRKLLYKPFVDDSQRTATFRKSEGTWKLDAIDLARIHPTNSALRVGSFGLSVDGKTPRRFLASDMLPVAELPLVHPGAAGRLEVQLSFEGESTDPGFHAFLTVPPMAARWLMKDDGKDGDVKAKDGVYTARFSFPEQPGLRHLVVEAIAARTLADPTMTNYDAAQWGIPYRVLEGEAR